MKNPRKHILLFTILFAIVSANATNMYWIGGTGAWKDGKHWSLNSGGMSSNTTPTSSDDVFFDRNSFTADKQTVMLTSNEACHNIDWSDIDDKVIFSSADFRSLNVTGSYTLSPLLWNGFKGKTIFSSTSFY